jgi:hypothetical protein
MKTVSVVVVSCDNPDCKEELILQNPDGFDPGLSSGFARSNGWGILFGKDICPKCIEKRGGLPT